MNEKLAELDAKIAPGDEVFFYFAGHGVALGAENYLLPRDLPKPNDGEENLVRDEGHSVDAIVRRVQGRGAGQMRQDGWKAVSAELLRPSVAAIVDHGLGR